MSRIKVKSSQVSPRQKEKALLMIDNVRRAYKAMQAGRNMHRIAKILGMKVYDARKIVKL